MAPTLAARLSQDNVASLPKQRSHLEQDSVIKLPTERDLVPGRSVERAGHNPRCTARKEPSASVAKRLFDIAVATGTLIFFAPFLITVAILIKVTSPGPVLFSQYRYGYRNRLFRIYKLRSMRVDACDTAGVKQTVQGDYRITSIGKILRKTSLDEIPQLINVIKGDMSLVGPRPHVPGMLAAGLPYEDLVPYYFERHTMRPGITGLAQVSGCRGSTVDRVRAISRIDYDLEYVENWSLRMDIMIIAHTIRREFLSGSGF